MTPAWLDVKYIRYVGNQLSRFKELRSNLWNFRCPVCGDSDSDPTKTRGYIFLKEGEYKFKCHNCGEHWKFSWFLKNIAPELYKEYRMELFKENSGGKTRKKPTKKPKFKRRDRVAKPKPVVPEKLKGLEPVSMLPHDHFVVEYVSSRGIPENRWNDLFWSNNMREIADHVGGYDDLRFDDHPRLLLPFINRDGVMTHIQGRAIGDNVPKKSRYYTLEVEEGHPKVFGLNRIDDSQPVKVVEGPIDSLFLPNCTGMGGADVPWHLFDAGNTIFVWDNEPRSPQIIKRMKEAISRGFKVCIWGKSIRKKDINDMVLDGFTPTKLDRYISDHSVAGMKAKMALSQFKVRSK